VVKAEYYPSVIRSRRRFTYQEALRVLQGKGGDEIERMVRDAGRLAQRIRAARMKAGSLNMDFPEHKLRLDERGRFSHVEIMENDESHQLIEEFMLLANEAVAGRLRQQNRAAVYRIHEDPDPERLEELRQEMRAMGVPAGNLAKKGELQKLIARLKEHPASDALMISVLRSLKRARYAVEPLGHFGLGKRDYTHFTSPIRRYADLLVHRALFESRRPAREELVEVADRISFTERNSADAEQDSKTVKIMAHLEGQLTSEQRETYEGVITNVLNFGFMLEVAALGIGGMVRVSSLEDDFYVYEESRNRLRGRRRRRTFEIGNPVTVQVTSVDRFKKQVNFRLAERGRKR
jgi:ribonuclease R